jgi:hypothetical protein
MLAKFAQVDTDLAKSLDMGEWLKFTLRQICDLVVKLQLKFFDQT